MLGDKTNMDIQFAILGFLSWQPFSGYDLKKAIAESDLFYWSGNNNQIYKSLVGLHQAGLVTQQVQLQESLPARKVYTITPLGREALRAWLLSAPEPPDFRDTFLIQLAWSEPLTTKELDAQLGRYEEEMDVQLRMRRARAGLADPIPRRSPREALLWKRIAGHMAGWYERELEWVREVRADLRAETY
jgi:PadR family transcriptional regulator, regulatory protein AphA